MTVVQRDFDVGLQHAVEFVVLVHERELLVGVLVHAANLLRVKAAEEIVEGFVLVVERHFFDGWRKDRLGDERLVDFFVDRGGWK